MSMRFSFFSTVPFFVHQIKSRNNEVMLHSESPLGEITLECFLTGIKNVFSLGFVPVKEDLVVLLARDVEVRGSCYCTH